MSGAVRAAGGLVRRSDGRIAIVHRPRYDDWSLPKGKADGTETVEETALREVEEETGLRCRLGPPAGETRYVDGRGRQKVVTYWHMTPTEDRPFRPSDEVDQLRWCTADEAGRLLSYVHDRELVERALARSHARGAGGSDAR